MTGFFWKKPNCYAFGAFTPGLHAGLYQAPPVDSNRWAVSGMANLGDALSWAARSTEGSERDIWLFQRGAWLAGRGEPDAALEILGSPATIGPGRYPHVFG